jgi:hypothetical protein
MSEVIHEIEKIRFEIQAINIYKYISIISLNEIPAVPAIKKHWIQRLHNLSENDGFIKNIINILIIICFCEYLTCNINQFY